MDEQADKLPLPLGAAVAAVGASRRASFGNAALVPWKPGQTANPTGTNGAGLAKYVRIRTRDGQELVETLLACVLDERARWRDRVAAVGLLLDRGWGRARESVDVQVSERTEIKLVWSAARGVREDGAGEG